MEEVKKEEKVTTEESMESAFQAESLEEQNQDLWPEKTAEEPATVKYQTGAEKLTEEFNKILLTMPEAYRDVAKKQNDLILNCIVERCNRDKAFDALVLQEHKSWERCMQFCGEKAQETVKPTADQIRLAREGKTPIVAPIGSRLVFHWIDEYYHLDDKAQIEKEKKKKEEEKKRSEKLKKEMEERKKKAATYVKPAKKASTTVETPKKVEKPKPETEQLSLFDLM